MAFATTRESPPSDPRATIRIALPESLLNAYEAQARNYGVDVEALISDRLADSINHIAAKPLYFNDEQRQQLEQCLGRNVLHTQDALLQVRNAMSVRVGKVIVGLKVNLLAKLKSRCIGMPFEEFLEQRVVQALEQYVGLR